MVVKSAAYTKTAVDNCGSVVYVQTILDILMFVVALNEIG
jgi:hypothetical protein